MTASVSGLAAALLIPAQLLAATPSHQCAQLWDDVLRLSCYDTAFGKPRPPAEAAAAQSAAPVAPAASAAPVVPAAAAASAAPAAAVVATTAAAPAAAAPASAATAPAAASAPVPPATNTRETGKKSGDVTATVTAVSQSLDGRLRVTLDNGQVWQQTELDSVNPVRTTGEAPHQLFQVKSGDRVTVKSGLLGSRQMVAVDGRAVRVTLAK